MNDMGDEAQRSKVVAFIDSVFAVSIMERASSDFLQVLDSVRGETIRYLASPYEQFCSENVSFLIKLLRSAKLGEGLNFILKENGL